ncbi:cyclase family protein [Haliangium sp.]|uniref:cyclase family protein n=1 Tax=Haliangium sp. TaxID=2663208 RepID=UPI003D114418
MTNPSSPTPERAMPQRTMPQRTMIDLSHAVEHGLVTYPGLPAPIISDHLSRDASRAHYAPGTEFQIGKLEMIANTGTYLDTPFHRYPDGKDLAELPLTSLADLACEVIRADTDARRGGGRAIDAPLFADRELAGKAVLVHTGWSSRWNTPAYGVGHPFLTEAAARLLVDAGAALVGIDSLNIDDDQDGRRPVHSTLLAAEIPLVEHMTNLAALPERGARFFAVPVKVRGFGSFPVRAFAIADL